jgi:beta-glucosidase
VTLAAGGSTTLHFTLNRDSVGFYDNQGHFLVEPGRIDLYAGDTSTATLTTTFTVGH